MRWPDHFSDDERALAREALIAVLHGPWISPRAFQTRLGVFREEAAAVLSDWPGFRDPALAAQCVRAALVEVALGIRADADEWSRWFSAPRGAYQAVLDRFDAVASS